MLDALNRLILQISENGQSAQMYNLFQLLNVPVCMAYGLWYGHKLRFGLKKTLLLLLLAFVAIYGWMMVFYWINSGFQSFGGQNMVTIFVHVPIIALGLSRILKINWTEECYFHAGSLPLMHGVGHFGCMFTGCCGGYPAEWGIIKAGTGVIHFPIQLIESCISLLIALILLIRSHKNDYIADAKQFPIMMVMFGSARFVCEFFRANEKILFGCSALAFHALFLCAVGITWLAILKHKEKAKTETCPN